MRAFFWHQRASDKVVPSEDNGHDVFGPLNSGPTLCNPEKQMRVTIPFCPEDMRVVLNDAVLSGMDWSCMERSCEIQETRVGGALSTGLTRRKQVED